MLSSPSVAMTSASDGKSDSTLIIANAARARECLELTPAAARRAPSAASARPGEGGKDASGASFAAFLEEDLPSLEPEEE